MTVQKRGLWLFLFSFIPGAGELYMGFRKQGVSIMAMFWSCIAVASFLDFGWLTMGLPVIWFYSFFNVHNLKSLTPEEFYSLEDDYVLHMDRIFRDRQGFYRKYRPIIAVVLVIIGFSSLWNIMFSFLNQIIPAFLLDIVYQIGHTLPKLVLSCVIIGAGIYMIMGKRAELREKDDPLDGAHF